jgi:hypothetical protein
VTAESEPGIRRILLSVVMLAAIFLLSTQRLRPPAPKSADSSAAQFSAGRALEILVRLMGDEAPHPVGSDANRAVRGQILREFARIGYHSDLQTAFSCNPYGTCATVNNVVARLEGRDQTAVLLAAHYDSVPAGPGVSDDGVGVAAALEIARALKSHPTPRHSIIFLIDDGEEGGLLGARAFVDSHPWAKDVRAVVNLDARGTAGQACCLRRGRRTTGRLDSTQEAHLVRLPAPSSIRYTNSFPTTQISPSSRQPAMKV